MAETLVLPDKLQAGDVIEWIFQTERGGSAWLKFYTNDGQEISRQIIKNGCLKDIFDFLAIGENLAQENGLVFQCQPVKNSGGITPIRGIFLSQKKSHI